MGKSNSGSLKKYTKEFISATLSALEGKIESIPEKIIRIESLKKRISRYNNTIILKSSAFTILFIGLAMLLHSYFPNWIPGISYILIGIILLAIIFLHKKYK